MTVIFSISFVNAEEYPEITNDVELRYRWYKEVITGDYYPLKDITQEDKIDLNKIKYGNYSDWKEEYCSLSEKYYEISSKKIYIYKKLQDTKNVVIENINNNTDIKIYYQDEPINYEIISTDENEIKLDLKRNYLTDLLIFFIDNDDNYKITLYTDQTFLDKVASKEIQNEKIVSPDKNWIDQKTIYATLYTEKEIKESNITKKIGTRDECRYREKYIYKYQIQREYYDDNYYLNIEGYIKDINDYKIFYKGEPITNTIEITKEKIVKEEQIEYVYIENDKNEKKDDSSQEKNYDLNTTSCTPEVKTEIVEKQISKIPKKIYIIIILLIAIIIFLVVKLRKKYVVWRLWQILSKYYKKKIMYVKLN